MSNRPVVLLARLFAAGVFLYAGVAKAIDPARFAGDIESYRLLPQALVPVVALYLPWLEISCGVCLLLRRLYAAAVVATMVLMFVFTTALVAAAARGLDIRCGCFGTTNHPTSYPWLITRDLLIAGGLGLLWVIELRRPAHCRS